jgi:hypothetical protein
MDLFAATGVHFSRIGAGLLANLIFTEAFNSDL